MMPMLALDSSSVVKNSLLLLLVLVMLPLTAHVPRWLLSPGGGVHFSARLDSRP